MRVPFVKHGRTLVPYDESANAIMDRFAQGDVIWMEPRQPRNEKHHRLYWALINLVYQNIDQDRYPTPDDLHEAIKISAGLRTQIMLPDGRLAFKAGSIAWGKMDQVAFSQFYDRVCDTIAKHFLPGVTSATLKAEVEEMIGVTA